MMIDGADSDGEGLNAVKTVSVLPHTVDFYCSSQGGSFVVVLQCYMLLCPLV